MMLLDHLDDPAFLLAMLAALVVGFTVHEYSHARVAFQLGDYTAYMQGRLTLDPRRHIDPLGMLMFLMAGFGWAKPVPIDPHRLGRRGTLEVSLAGPVSNLLLAAVAALPVRLGLFGLDGPAGWFLFTFASFNIVLAVFNMLPVPPLDGWKVLLGLVPSRVADLLEGVGQFGFMALFALLMVGSFAGFPLLSTLLRPFIVFFQWLLLGTAL